MKNNAEQRLLELFESLAETTEREIDCDQFLERVAAFVEHIDAGTAISDEFLDEARHIRICADCREEFDALLAMIRDK